MTNIYEFCFSVLDPAVIAVDEKRAKVGLIRAQLSYSVATNANERGGIEPSIPSVQARQTSKE